MSEEIMNENLGKINISEEVVSVITSVTASAVNGVHGMCNSLTGGIAELFGKKNMSKGVRAEITENNVKISALIIVDANIRIPDVAVEVQEKVKKEVEAMTGLNVVAVDVFVNGIFFSKGETEVGK